MWLRVFVSNMRMLETERRLMHEREREAKISSRVADKCYFNLYNMYGHRLKLGICTEL